MTGLETAPLRAFATWARTALIGEVTARIAAVLAPGSTVRVEHARTVAALEKAVADAGGGDKGRAAIADTVAYTWFNRIIALRFMDANGYTGIGVVSPQAGVDVGQPEILADAKRGVIDTGVVSETTRTAVAGLLDGTRASGDPQGEAYALLLTDYCRHWNRAMPFMFERAGDFTELLIPANLLADDSVLNRSVPVLTKDVCKDVEVVGWLYQFYISERKDEVFAGFKKNKKAGAAEIPAATQLFTPHWIVRYLVENSLGRLWLLNRPASRLAEQMDYYIAPADEETDFLKIASPEELRIIDPACGSGHMLTYAFDLLYAIYEEEGYAPSDIPELILGINLYGTEIDPRAGALAAFALTMKARARQRTFFIKQVHPNICVLESISFASNELDFLMTASGDRHEEQYFWNQFEHADTLGSLIQPDHEVTTRLGNHLATLDDGGDMLAQNVIERAQKTVVQAKALSPRYAVVVANPPYMRSRHMAPRLADFAKVAYPNSKSDLYSMFIERNIAGCLDGGMVGMITMQSWMFLSTFQALRATTLSESKVATLAHLGTGAFDSIGGEVVSTAAFVLRLSGTPTIATFIRLTDLGSEEAKASALLASASGRLLDRTFLVRPDSFSDIPGSPFAYWLPEDARRAFATLPAIGALSNPRVGMQTSNNGKYLRSWWEVSASEALAPISHLPKWVTYLKGGPFRRWYGNVEHILHYNGDPAYVLSQLNATILPLERAMVPKVTWTDITTGEFSARIAPGGSFHDISGHCFYPAAGQESWVLGYANSRVFQMFLSALNSTIHAQVGDVARIPVTHFDQSVLSDLVNEAVELSKRDFDRSELSSGFVGLEITSDLGGAQLEFVYEQMAARWARETDKLGTIEEAIDHLTDPDGLSSWFRGDSYVRSVSLSVNPLFSFSRVAPEALDRMLRADVAKALVSYAAGCMCGRYSLDEPGLILASQGDTLQDYLAKVPIPSFMPDKDNVIPIVDGDWFEDDIVARFRQFLRAAFGGEHFEENLRFVTEALDVNDLRDYFVKSFYKDHVQRYKKRPIYWLFSSPKGSFNALIYMHRYTPSTVSTVLNEYLHEFQAKHRASLEHAERSNNSKEADRIREVLLELDEYEHDTLYPLASQNIAIDLDDGVKANYPKFGDALKKIPGVEATE